MKILVLGSGGREHAVVKKLAKSPLCEVVYALPGNPGMKEAICLPGDVLDIKATVRTALSYQVDFCVVTPDDPLALGMVDAMEQAGIPCFGPNKQAARIEASKVFSKELMQKHHIPTAQFAAFDNLDEAQNYITSQRLPLVIKADGLARGKGVVIAQTIGEAQQALVDMLKDKVFGDSGSRVIVEEFLSGPEVSVLAFTDGNTIVPLLSAMDHKRALDHDQGMNTGGMGAIAPNPLYTKAVADQAMQHIFLPTVRAMQQEGCPFSGCLFFGLILTQEGPKVLEYNARLGDPETQAVLPLLESDLLSAMLAVRQGKLKDTDLRFSPQSSCCVVLASAGYPGQFDTGFAISISDTPDAQVDYAGVRESEGRLQTAGGRVMSITATGDSLYQAIDKAYGAIKHVHFEGMRNRGDIGARALEG